MTRHSSHLVSAALAGIGLLCSQTVSASCHLEQQTAVPIEQVGGLLVVSAIINSIKADFVLDTGAERSVVGIAAADRLHIARDEWVSTDIQGVGGRDRRRLGRPSSFSLGGVTLRRHTVAADASVVVGPIPTAIDNRPIAGLLGQDFLSPFDLDLDLRTNRLTLFSVSGCTGRFLPWKEPYDALAAWRPMRNVLTLPMRIGTTPIQALLDSGAGQSVITLPGMIALHLAPGGSDAVRGVGAGSVTARMQHFPAVQVGTFKARPTDLVVAPIHTPRSVGALLGADWLAGRHVWISWATDQIFVARPDGG